MCSVRETIGQVVAKAGITLLQADEGDHGIVEDDRGRPAIKCGGDAVVGLCGIFFPVNQQNIMRFLQQRRATTLSSSVNRFMCFS